MDPNRKRGLGKRGARRRVRIRGLSKCVDDFQLRSWRTDEHGRLDFPRHRLRPLFFFIPSFYLFSVLLPPPLSMTDSERRRVGGTARGVEPAHYTARQRQWTTDPIVRLFAARKHTRIFNTATTTTKKRRETTKNKKPRPLSINYFDCLPFCNSQDDAPELCSHYEKTLLLPQYPSRIN